MNGTKAMLALVALACAASAGAASTPPAAAGVLVNLVRTDSASQGHFLTCVCSIVVTHKLCVDQP